MLIEKKNAWWVPFVKKEMEIDFCPKAIQTALVLCTDLCMMLVWVVELFILFKGLKVYGKVAYFITLSPYFVLTAFLAYGLTREGAKDGIDYYLKPNWDDLMVRLHILYDIVYLKDFILKC